MFCMLKIYIYIYIYISLTQTVKNKLFFQWFQMEKKWHYLAVKKLSCLNCFHSTENRLQLHKRACENKDFYNVNLPSKDSKILQFNQYQKSDKKTIYYLCRSWVYNRKDWWMPK